MKFCYFGEQVLCEKINKALISCFNYQIIVFKKRDYSKLIIIFYHVSKILFLVILQHIWVYI